MTEQRVNIGYVRSVDPAKRQVRIKTQPLCRAYYDELTSAVFVLSDGNELRCRIDKVRPTSPDDYIVLLAKGVTRDNTARLRGAAVVVNMRQDRHEWDGSYHPETWIGWTVTDQTGKRLGTITDGYATPANGVFEITAENGAVWALPAIEHVIEWLDEEQGAIVVRDIAPYAVEIKQGGRNKKQRPKVSDED